MGAGAGVFREAAEDGAAGGRICSDRGGLRIQRLAAEAAGRVRLPRDVLVQPEKQSKKKTDRRDANAGRACCG